MKISNGFKWALVILSTFGLGVVLAERLHWLDKWLTVAPETSADANQQITQPLDTLYKKTKHQVDAVLPYFSSPTLTLTEAINIYALAPNATKRTELAFKIAALNQADQPLTDYQRQVLDHSEKYLIWVNSLVAYYLQKIPDTELQKLSFQVDDSQQLSSSLSRDILYSNLTPTQELCTESDIGKIRDHYSEEFLARNYPEAVHYIAAMKEIIVHQAFSKLEAPLLEAARVSQYHSVLKVYFEVGKSVEEKLSKVNDKDKDQERGLATRLEHVENREQFLALYNLSPNCFAATVPTQFTHAMEELRTRVVGRHYWNRIRLEYSKTHHIVEDLTQLAPEPAVQKVDALFDSPKDAWGSPFVVRIEGNIVKLISSGPDRELNTPDDLVAAEGDVEQPPQ